MGPSLAPQDFTKSMRGSVTRKHVTAREDLPDRNEHSVALFIHDSAG